MPSQSPKSRPLTVDEEIAAEQLLTEFLVDHPDDIQLLAQFLGNVWGNSKALSDLVRYRHTPVGPREFIESPQFMNKRGVLWPTVLDELERINDGTKTEAVLTGGIGVAKTTLALYTQAYQLYLLSCLRDPHKEMDLDPASEILIVFQSINKELAQGVDYARFREMIRDAPYFKMHFPFDGDRKSDMSFPHRIIIKPISGMDTGAIGQNVIGGVIDEVNYMAEIEGSKLSKDGDVYNQAVSNYNSIAKRRESRFMQKGWMPGMLCLVSSRNFPGQFTDIKEAEARKNPRIYVYDKRLWELRPERFSFHDGYLSEELARTYPVDTPLWFNIFVGDATRKPRILQTDETVKGDDQALVMPIPLEYLASFEKDILTAIRDIAGQSTQALHPFMLNTDAVSACFGKVKSVLSREDCDFVSTKVQLYPKRITRPQEPRFCHIDLAVSRDSAGVAVGHVPGFTHMKRGDYIETLPLIQFDCTLEVRPPRGGEIEFEQIRKLIYALRKMLPIKWVSFDQFQSKDSMQIMAQNGFIVGYQSMDVDTFAYDVIKQAFYDGRVSTPEHKKALSEMVRLEFDAKTRKIDHPPQGSKDISDSMAGVAYGLTMRRELWVRHSVPLNRIPASIIAKASNETKGSVSAKERLLANA